jgi:hypothetical protein
MNIKEFTRTHNDKIKHFLGCFIVNTAFLLAFKYILIFEVSFLQEHYKLSAFIMTLSIGVAKELVHDKLLKRGTPDWWDMVANLVGMGLSSLFL